MAVACSSPTDSQTRSSPEAPERRSSPSPLGGARRGGVAANAPLPTIPPHERPYPYLTPTPPPVASALDGTYIRVVSVEKAGGVPAGLPPYCLRCLPYRLTAGVSTLVFHKGEHYLNHQLSGFKSQGHFTVSGRRLTMFNEANCHEPAVYSWRVTGNELTLELVDDPCPYANVRAEDLTSTAWIRVNPCLYRINNLWPAAVAC